MAELTFLHQGAEWRLWVQGADEFLAADNWLADVLTADPILAGIVADRIGQGLLPEDTPAPFISYAIVTSEEDDRTTRTRCARLIYRVEVVAAVSLGEATDLVSAATTQITSLLAGAGPVSRDEGTIIACQRVRPWRLEETKEAG